MGALATLPPVLERRATEVLAIAAYLDRYAVIADTGQVAAMNPLRDAHLRARPQLGAALHRCAQSLMDRAAAVRAALRSYAAADQASRASLDALVGGPVHHGRSLGR